MNEKCCGELLETRMQRMRTILSKLMSRLLRQRLLKLRKDTYSHAAPGLDAITPQYNPRKSLHRRGTKVLRKKPVASMDARKVSSQFTLL